MTEDEIDDKISEWHDGAGEGKSLIEYLGMTKDEYKKFLLDGDIFYKDKL